MNENTTAIFENHMPYTVVSNELIRDTNLSLKARGLACYMCSMAEGWSFSYRRLASSTGEGESLVRAALNELINAGYLTRTKYKDEQGFFRCKYDLYPTPSLQNPSVENPCVENPRKENHRNIEEHNNRITNIKNTITPTKRKAKQFVPPTLEEVKAYIESKHYNVDANYFYEYFSAGNWIDSQGKPVKNWKQKIITWAKGNYGANTNTSVVRPNYQQVDMSQYENRPVEETNFLDELENL